MKIKRVSIYLFVMDLSESLSENAGTDIFLCAVKMQNRHVIRATATMQ
jgi:hypothetical protein